MIEEILKYKPDRDTRLIRLLDSSSKKMEERISELDKMGIRIYRLDRFEPHYLIYSKDDCIGEIHFQDAVWWVYISWPEFKLFWRCEGFTNWAPTIGLVHTKIKDWTTLDQWSAI